MGIYAWILSTLTIIVAISLTVFVMMQNSKEGQSAITGNNTFYGSNKGKTLDGLLSKLTAVFAVIFIVLCFLTTIAIIK